MFLEGHAPSSEPRLTLTSGGTASGKSDATAEAKKQMPDAVYANTDEIRALMPEFPIVEGTDKAGLLQEEAGEIRDQLLAEAVAAGMDIIWDAPGNPSHAEYLNDVEEYGFSITVAYTHRGVQESKKAAEFRAKNASNPADRRVVPDSVIENSHKKARAGFNAMAGALEREVIVYDKSNKARGETADIIYHRKRDGSVVVKQSERLKVFSESGEPLIDLGLL
jgi:predicted kinase